MLIQTTHKKLMLIYNIPENYNTEECANILKHPICHPKFYMKLSFLYFFHISVVRGNNALELTQKM